MDIAVNPTIDSFNYNPDTGELQLTLYLHKKEEPIQHPDISLIYDPDALRAFLKSYGCSGYMIIGDKIDWDDDLHR